MAKKAAATKPVASQHTAEVEANGKQPHSTWTGELTVGPIRIPVRLFTAARGERISFNQLHGGEKGCGGRLSQGPMHCKACDVDVPREDIVKGYEVRKDVYVQISDDEIKAQKPESGSMMDVERFVPLSQVNPIYFESSYYLAIHGDIVPKEYAVLRQGMLACQVAAVTKVTIRNQENVMFVMPHPDGGFVAYSAFLSDEVRPIRFAKLPEVSVPESKAVADFIQSRTDVLEMSQYTDSYRENIMGLIMAKEAGEKPKVVEIKPRPKADSGNLIELLTLSAQQARAKRGKKTA